MYGISARKLATILALTAVGAIGSPAVAQAHVGVGPAHDLLHGFEHPLTGVDHLCAMIAVGIWAAQRGGRAIWLVPLTFVLVMAVGGGLGMIGVRLPLAEAGIVSSLLVLGVLVALAVRLPLAATTAIVALFALVHGYAHGAELPVSASAVSYLVGFILATAGLHLVGIAFGVSMQRLRSSHVARLAGAAIALCGVWLCIR